MSRLRSNKALVKVKPYYKILSYGAGSYKEGLHMRLMEKLEKETFDKAVVCPSYEDSNQWIVIHLVFFFNDINVLYGAVQEHCTNFSCPYMSAGEHFEYLWVDHYRYNTVTSLPAKTYIDFLIQWISKQLEKESLFPADKNSIFPQQYVNKVKSVVKRYFRIYAHIYHSHLNTLKDLKMDTAFLDSLAYFFYFIDLYSLIPLIDLRPLSCAIHQLVPNLNITRLLIQEEIETRKPQEEKPVSQLISEKADCFHSSPIAPSGEAEASATSFQPTLPPLDVWIAPKSRERRRGAFASFSTPIEGSGSLTCTIL